MNMRPRRPEKHLRPEELERLALPDGRKLPARSSAHAAECDRCRGAVAELQSLHAQLQTLTPLHPMIGFSDRVMRRVRLPVPWRVRVLQAVRKHQVGTAAAVAGAMATVGVGLMWIARYPELTPVTVAAFLVEKSSSLLWGGVMQVGRFVYGTGLVQAAQDIAGQLTPLTGFVAVATVLFVGLAALRIMVSLLNVTTVSPPATGR
ncbi:MAG: hypothetical protein M8866_05965 [marine benthic group bacterium]|nr:hypothetical protein [Candidatus Benthicola marisminoris]